MPASGARTAARASIRPERATAGRPYTLRPTIPLRVQGDPRSPFDVAFPGSAELHDHLPHVPALQEVEERLRGVLDPFDDRLAAVQLAGGQEEADVGEEVVELVEPVHHDETFHRQPLADHEGEVARPGGR